MISVPYESALHFDAHPTDECVFQLPFNRISTNLQSEIRLKITYISYAI